MRLPRVLANRLRSLFRRSRVEDDLQLELEIHIEQLTKEYIADGMSESEARFAARREFGPVESMKEECRDTRRVNCFDDLLKDLAYASRLLRKSPAFTLTAVLSLALGIGANTAIFSLVQQVVLRLLPIRDPASLVIVNRQNLEMNESSFSYLTFRDLQTAKGLPFDGFLAYSGMGRITLATDSGAGDVATELISGNYFDLLGVRPQIGRLFTADDDRTPGAHPVVVLSHNFWSRRFGRDPSILNATLRLNNHPFTVIGVSASGFDGLNPGSPPDVFLPINMEKTLGYSPASAPSVLTDPGSWWLAVYGRIKPGVSYEQAGAALLPVLLRNLSNQESFTATEYGRKFRASETMRLSSAAQGTGGMRRRFERGLWALTAIVAVVLLLATVNIAHLLLARASTREREFSLRAAIGASRARVGRQLLTESLLLAFLGGALGLFVAQSLGQVLLNLVVTDHLRSTLDLTATPALLAFNFGITTFAGLLFGLAPALRSSKVSLIPGLKGIQSTAGNLTMRKLFISVQAALSIILLIGAGLFVRTVQSLRGIDLGFQAENVIQFGLDPVGYAPSRVHPFYENVQQRIAALPGVRAAAIGRQRLVNNSRWSSGIAVEGYVAREGERAPFRDAVGPGYFSTIGIPMLAGREFTGSDRAASAKVAIVNEEFAKAYFPGQNPLGKRIGPGGTAPPEHTIVGVVRTAKYASLRETPARFWYVPYQQIDQAAPERFRALTVSVRTASDPSVTLKAIRSEIDAVDKNVAMFAPRTIEAQIGDQLLLERLLATLSVFFGLLAAILAAVGLFGVLSWSVSQRYREIGIRMALGARPGEIAWNVVRDVVVYTGTGLVAGIAISLSLNDLVERLLFGVKPNDAIAIAAACCVMIAVAAIAAYLPARRAATVEPSVAFRTE